VHQGTGAVRLRD